MIKPISIGLNLISNPFLGRLVTIDKDPSKHNIGEFYSVVFSGGKLTACIDVCDDKPVIVDFTKKA